MDGFTKPHRDMPQGQIGLINQRRGLKGHSEPCLAVALHVETEPCLGLALGDWLKSAPLVY